MSRSEETKAPPYLVSEDWSLVPWRQLEPHVYRLQKRIYRAANRGNVQAVHRLQELLLRSRAARLLAVRRVTQDNQGQKTAGVEGVKSLTPSARLASGGGDSPHAPAEAEGQTGTSGLDTQTRQTGEASARHTRDV